MKIENKTCAIQTVQKHQPKYFIEVAKWINGTILTRYKNDFSTLAKSKAEIVKLVEKNNIDYMVSGARINNTSVYGVAPAGQAASKKKKLVWIWHKLLLDKNSHKYVTPIEAGQYSVLPEYFKSVLGLKHNKNMFFYKGHYLSVHHHMNPPESKCKGHVLFTPQVGTNPAVVKDALVKLQDPFKIRLHPAEYINPNNTMGRITSSRYGYDEYLKVFGENYLIDFSESTTKSIDESIAVFSNYDSSVLIESAVRGKLFGVDRKILVTKFDKAVYKRAGITRNKNPTSIDDFQPINETILDQCCLTVDETKKNFIDSMSEALNSERISAKDVDKMMNKFYFPNIG